MGRDTFYGLLASLRGKLLRDTGFAGMGDTARGHGGAHQGFVGAGRKLVARVPGRPNRKHFPKEDFVIDLMAGSCTCPAGQVTRTIAPAGKRTDSTGTTLHLRAFRH